MGAGAQKSGGAAALPAPPPPRSLNPRAGGASYSIDSHEAFPSGMYLKKNIYSMREHTKGVVTTCKGGHDYQPLAVSYTIRLPLSLHPSNMHLSSDQGLLFVQIL